MGPGGLDVQGQSLVGREGEIVQQEYAYFSDGIVGFADEMVHVEQPMGGVDLLEGGDVEREASIGEHHSKHY